MKWRAWGDLNENSSTMKLHTMCQRASAWGSVCQPRSFVCEDAVKRLFSRFLRPTIGGPFHNSPLFAHYPLSTRPLLAYHDQAVWFILAAMSESMQRTFDWSRSPSCSSPFPFQRRRAAHPLACGPQGRTRHSMCAAGLDLRFKRRAWSDAPCQRTRFRGTNRSFPRAVESPPTLHQNSVFGQLRSPLVTFGRLRTSSRSGRDTLNTPSASPDESPSSEIFILGLQQSAEVLGSVRRPTLNPESLSSVVKPSCAVCAVGGPPLRGHPWLIPIRFQDETKCGKVRAWQDHAGWIQSSCNRRN